MAVGVIEAPAVKDTTPESHSPAVANVGGGPTRNVEGGGDVRPGGDVKFMVWVDEHDVWHCNINK